MKNKWKYIKISIFVMVALSISLPNWAQGFWKIGTRALGMGGAYVAAGDDSLSAYWNPAGICFFQRYDFAFSYGILAQQEGKPINLANDLLELNINGEDSFNEADLSSAIEILDSLNQEGLNVNGHMQLGIFGSGASWAVSMVEWKGAIIRPEIDLLNVDYDIDSPNFIGNNTSQLHIQGLKAREYVFTVSYPIFVPQIMIGFNAKYMQIETYETNALILKDFGESISATKLVRDTFNGPLGKGSSYSFDFGVLAEFSKHIRVGVVGKNLRKPTFDLDNEKQLQLQPQWRGGVAVIPTPSTTISVDFDIMPNKWHEDDDLEFRELAAGVEQWILDYRVAIRGGGYYNLAAKEPGFVYTFGGCARMGTFFIDFAMAYQPQLNDFKFLVGSSIKF